MAASAVPSHADCMPGAIMPMLALGGLVLLVIFSGAPTSSRPRQVALATVALSDDDGDAALFHADRMTPGKAVSNCIRVTRSGDVGAGEVRLVARDVVGPLARALVVRVDIGTGGRFGDCSGFSGTEVYNGTLAGLASGSGTEPGIMTGWAPLPGEVRTFRLIASVPDDGSAQGTSATATLSWLLMVEPSLTPTTPPAAPRTVPPTSPPVPDAPEPLPEPPTGISSSPASESPVVPGAEAGGASPSGSAGPGQPDHAGRPGQPRGLWAAMNQALRQFGAVAVNLAIRTTRHLGIPLTSVVTMTVFLLIQNRIDRRDPKLALAPVTREPYLHFEPHSPAGPASQ